ncbi:DUF397 domain-containing protein [Streptomyces sp. NPDC127108]|uniref:DUF397 domain-containing protein n=1 Tax=Streptomyces sp. NPDC127108 TaxID=3345361 RepID=UPI0036389946
MTLPPTIRWRKSSYSNGMGGECLEVASLLGDIAVRDSKVISGPWITVGTGAWESFVAAVRKGNPTRATPP